jgi:hypothetical protein
MTLMTSRRIARHTTQMRSSAKVTCDQAIPANRQCKSHAGTWARNEGQTKGRTMIQMRTNTRDSTRDTQQAIGVRHDQETRFYFYRSRQFPRDSYFVLNITCAEGISIEQAGNQRAYHQPIALGETTLKKSAHGRDSRWVTIRAVNLESHQVNALVTWQRGETPDIVRESRDCVGVGWGARTHL